jgi:hypothetical protein
MIKNIARVARILEIAQNLAAKAPKAHRCLVENHVSDIQIADYSEPGYKGFAVFGDWNNVDTYDPSTQTRVDVSNIPSRLEAIFSKMGISCEWSEQWCSCEVCGRMFQTANMYTSIRFPFKFNGAAMEKPNWKLVLEFVQNEYKILRSDEYRHSHPSHAAIMAMQNASNHFDLDLTVEGHSFNREEGFGYLNMGDPYIETIVFNTDNEFEIRCAIA